MKKIISILLCGIMILGLVGCGADKKESSKNIPVKVSQKEIENNDQDKEDKAAEIEAENAMIEESKIKYEELINDIENSIPEMTVKYVKEKEDSRIISIDINLLSNIDDTVKKCSELAIKKETVMKNEGITTINIWVRNGEKTPGMVSFELRNGIYDLTLNTLGL